MIYFAFMVTNRTGLVIVGITFLNLNFLKVPAEKDVLPFCTDVLKIIIQYVPIVPSITQEILPSPVQFVVPLSPEVVEAQVMTIHSVLFISSVHPLKCLIQV